MNSPSGADEGSIDIRIRNDSTTDFDRVLVEFPDGNQVDYGPVPSGHVTDFRPTSLAYRYAGVSAHRGDRVLSFHPIDYLGEPELPAGRYTYALDVDDGQLTISAEKAT